MNGKIVSMTSEEMRKSPSATNWDRVRAQEPDMTDPDAPDFSNLMESTVKHPDIQRNTVAAHVGTTHK